jgi:hypothetical protein
VADNYSFKKRQRELAQKKKTEAKLQRRLEKKNPQALQPEIAENQTAVEQKGEVNGI